MFKEMRYVGVIMLRNGAHFVKSKILEILETQYQKLSTFTIDGKSRDIKMAAPLNYVRGLCIGTLIACLTINSSKHKTKQHSEIQNSFSNIQYFKESSSIFDF